jgi:uncharacterized protein (DUF2141 family)
MTSRPNTIGLINVPTLLAICGVAAGISTVQPYAQPQSASRSSVIEGKVLEHDGGTPLRYATVTLQDTTGRLETQTTTTNTNGEFVLTRLAAGRYTLSATKPAYLEGQFGSQGPQRLGHPITIAASQHLTNIVIKMWRGGVISGAIRDSNGDPLPNVPVHARRRVFTDGVPMLAIEIAGRDVTDDRGFYRVYGLSPGDYGVVAVPTNRVKPQGPDQPGYASVYFPGTPIADEARLISVNPSEEQQGIDFVLHLVRLSTVSGSLLPPINYRFSTLKTELLLTTDAVSSGLFLRQRVSVSPTGEFAVTGVAPGRYTLTARASIQPDIPNGDVWWASDEVLIAGQDVSGITLLLRSGSVITGTVRFRTRDPVPTVTPPIAIKLIPVETAQPHVEVREVATSKTTFKILGIGPGSYIVSGVVGPSRSPVQQWVLESALVDGIDAADVPLQVPGAGSAPQLLLTFTDIQTEVSGVLRDSSKEATSAYLVMAFPVDPRLWHSRSRRIRQVRPTANGRYLIAGLPPGDYALTAVQEVSPDLYHDKKLLAKLLSASSVRFSLADGERKQLDLMTNSMPK